MEREEARRQAGAVDGLAKEVVGLAEQADAHRAAWAISSQQLRDRRWTRLLKELRDGIRDGDDVVVVPGIPQPQARHVLALLQLACDHGDTTGERLGELLAAEDKTTCCRRAHACTRPWPG